MESDNLDVRMVMGGAYQFGGVRYSSAQETDQYLKNLNFNRFLGKTEQEKGTQSSQSMAYMVFNKQGRNFFQSDNYDAKDARQIVTGTVITTGNVSDLTFVSNIIFEGATADAFETTLAVTDPTADRTITFPDSTGTVALTSGVINNSLTTTTGDTIYASSANTPARLAIGTAGQTLPVSAGGIPEWATPAAGTTANDQAFAFAVQVFA